MKKYQITSKQLSESLLSVANQASLAGCSLQHLISLTAPAGSASLGRDCCGQEIIPIRGKKLSVYRNRHTNCDGTAWGWIEGCTLNICWSNNKQFNEQRARELAHRYNALPNDQAEAPGGDKNKHAKKE